MTRLLLLIFTLNILLAPVGAMARMPFGAINVMDQTSEPSVQTVQHADMSMCVKMQYHNGCHMDDMDDMDDMSNDLCKAKCATSCTTSLATMASFSFSLPFMLTHRIPEIISLPFYSRSISPELRPPLV